MKITVLDDLGKVAPDVVFFNTDGKPAGVTSLKGEVDLPAATYYTEHIGFKPEKVILNKEMTLTLTPTEYEKETVTKIAYRFKTTALPLIVLLFILYALSKK